MRAHIAVWLFASSNGNDYARQYAKKRLKFDESLRANQDSKFLRGRGGLRLRRAWQDLGEHECSRRMQDTPDETFPEGTIGILDERKRSSRTPRINQKTMNGQDYEDEKGAQVLEGKSTIESDSSKPRAPIPNAFMVERLNLIKDRTARMDIARSKYYDVLYSEHKLQIHNAYNSGSLQGVMESTIESIKDAIVLANVKDKPSTSKDAFEAIGMRVSRVFACLRGVSAFEPDPDYDEPDGLFAAKRIQQAKDKYDEAKAALEDLCNELGVAQPEIVKIGRPGWNIS